MTSRCLLRRLSRFIPMVLLTFLVGGAALAQVPPHLDILTATFHELPPIDRQNVPGRSVILSLTVAGTPVCNPMTGFLVYGFLIDADSSQATGVSMPPFDILGVDARVTATCNPLSGLFVSPIGTVTVTTGPGTTTIDILTTVERLPSLSCNWIAFAQENNLFSRLPQAPEFRHWTTTEKEVY